VAGAGFGKKVTAGGSGRSKGVMIDWFIVNDP
jgi:hypothetical protein